MAIEPIERNDTLADMAYDRLRTALMTGAFKPGDSLSIRQLARVLGISATPARDAISRMLWERGLESGPHRTVVVPMLTATNLREIYDVRLNLEGLAASAAAERFRDKDFTRLDEIEVEHREAIDAMDYKAALAANEAFHFTVYERSENSTLVEMIRSLWLKLGPAFNLLYPAYDKNRLGLTDHARIIAALRARDPEASRAALQADLRDGLAELERVQASLST